MRPVTPLYDAVVVGAGPAGSATARDIAREGLRVLLLEEHRRFGEPNHCSGLVTPRTLDLARVNRSLVLNEIRGVQVSTNSGTSVAIGGDTLQALVIDRVAFDRALVEQADEVGAQVANETKLICIERENDSLRLVLRSAGRSRIVETRLLVGADGSQSGVARWLNPHAAHGDRVVGLGAIAKLDSPSPDFVKVMVGPKVAPGFFAWLIPVMPGIARFGIASSARQPVHYVNDLLRAFPVNFRGVEFLEWSGGVVPLTLNAKPYASNVMLVGDAAGQVKPTSGGGIYGALIGAKHAAKTAIAALTEGDLTSSNLSRYHSSWLAELGGEYQRMQLLRRLFLALSDSDLDKLVRLFRSPSLSRLVAQHGDIDFPSRVFERLTSTVQHWKALVGYSPEH